MNYVKIYDNALPGNFCEHLISKFHQANSSLTVINETQIFDELNVSQDSNFKVEADMLLKTVRALIPLYLRDAEIEEVVWFDDFKFEEIRMKHYEKGKHHFPMHVDGGCDATSDRFLIALFYLNDVTEGGETVFYPSKLKVHPKQGSMVFFPATWTYPHSGEIPISNDKYIIGTYLRFK